jgi:hypothetical protein
MSRKNRKNEAVETASTAPETAPVETAAAEPVAEQTETAPVETAPQTATVVVEPTKPSPVYGIIATAEELGKRHFRKGFETVLIAELGRGPGDAQNLVDRMLASGEFQRVAPKAAELRPLKPTQELLNRWVGGKILAVASEEEAAAVRAAQAAAIEEQPADVPAEDQPVEIEEPANEAPAEQAPVEATV